MAVKTLKYGDLYLYRADSDASLIAASGYSYVGAFESGSQVRLMVSDASGMDRLSANHALTMSHAATPASVHAPGNMPAHPVFWVNDSTVHCWYGYDVLAGTAYTVFYMRSTDDGATWTTPVEVVTLGTGGSWNDVAMTPLLFWENPDDSALNRLYVAANDGANYKVGYYVVDASAGSWNVNLENPAKYSEYGSNPVTQNLGGEYIAMIHDGKRFCMYYGDDSTPDRVYFDSSAGGIVWNRAGIAANRFTNPILYNGIATTADDVYLRPTGAAKIGAWFYLFYMGYDGSTLLPMCAVGERPDHLYKMGSVANWNGGTSSDVGPKVYYSNGDLAYSVNHQTVHVADRGGAGALIDAPFEPWAWASSFKQQFIGPSGVVALSANSDEVLLWNHAMLANPSVGEGLGYGYDDPSRIHAVYLDKTTAGVDESFYIFLDCVISADVAESEEASDVTFSGTVNGARLPIFGRF